jgi:hypothetical protein
VVRKNPPGVLPAKAHYLYNQEIKSLKNEPNLPRSSLPNLYNSEKAAIQKTFVLFQMVVWIPSAGMTQPRGSKAQTLN